ncbi:hypothetical protein C9374_007587 [Naegleria lovaniensis]|uniref:Uncharacterized protein n=1 Tax=Naegleria lovaniensis TaxID=51637 RepID=A0AA88GK16_NAELO|nr:uncharacterized protein C9374_007587 [Naegleria lovaniensis]KAG2378949.1 hypothetical protein C9374_007587 [Naegleria lovaniensis]
MSQQPTLPTISGMQIESREEHSFPSSFSKKINIAVFGFSKEQKEHTKTWQAVFADMKREGGEWKEKDVDFNVFPLLPEMYWLLARGIFEAVRYGTVDDLIRQRTYLIHTDQVKFRQALGIESDDKICICVFAKDGTLLYKTREEAYTEERGTLFIQKVNELL